MRKLVLGILAHVDAGKTTLSEAMLYLSGNIQKLGRVDHKNAFLDTFALEQARGITIFSKQAILRTADTQISLLDTPGHVDFSAEMERTLRVLDYAILVVSATAGVQSHTETLWKLLKEHHIPTFLFCNKMDMPDTDRAALLANLEARLGEGFVDFTDGLQAESIQEALAMSSEAAMEHFLAEGSVPVNMIQDGIRTRSIFPCFFGAALKLEGVQTLLDGLSTWTVQPKPLPDFSAIVYKITRDEQGNRLTHLKLTGGSLRVKTTLSGIARDGAPWTEKIDRLHIYSGQKATPVDAVSAGDVCAVIGFTQTYAGQQLGMARGDDLPPSLMPVLVYRVEIPTHLDAHTVHAKLKLLEEEDPMLGVSWNETLGELHVQLMGEIQLEVLQSMLADRFGLQITFGQGSIVYQETIRGKVEGVGHFEPLRHYAEVHLLLEAGEQGSGMQFCTKCSEDILSKNWQRLILSHLQEKTHVGVLTGSALTDIKITLVTGKAHIKHTEGGDFRQATYRAVRQGVMQAESVLLEPYYAFKLEVPQENVGRAMTDLANLCGEVNPPETAGDMAVLTGTAPVAVLQGYHLEVTGYTKGLGRLSCTVHGYAPCHNSEEVIAQIGYIWAEDLANTPDSVYCTHGAGYTVPWNDVHEHMHMESALSKPKEELLPLTATRSSYQGSNRSRFSDDKELLAIFERTYGKIKERPIGQDLGYTKPARPVSQPMDRRVSPVPALCKEEYLLVDGYNIIFAWEELAGVANMHIDEAREKLINMLSNYAAFRKVHVIVVFDAYKIKGYTGEVEKQAGITIVYTKEAETADMYIEKATFQLAKNRRVRVATSDRLEQLIILGHGATPLSAQSFRTELLEIEKEMRCFL